MPDDVLRVNRSLEIPLAELEVRFSASGGPGGQHANKAATRVELTFDAAASPSLDERQRERITERLGPVVRVVVDDERSQLRNRVLAEQRLAARLGSALHVDPPRRATRPSRGAKERRLRSKRERSETKANRRRPPPDA
ncbi:MAG TPA: alternative ribosome rescue aminoacyl-tRNA hydrolase ArfB [Aquihabitans sp.]|nr:alternative ribosome rescue aminoacyl-tRNA hydrolase ArfB [Aquihabitans sp.]